MLGREAVQQNEAEGAVDGVGLDWVEGWRPEALYTDCMDM